MYVAPVDLIFSMQENDWKRENHVFILATTVNIHLLLKNLVEVRNNLVEQPQALDPLVVGLEFDVELGEIGNRGEDDAATVTLLVVQLLVSMEYNTWLRDQSHPLAVWMSFNVCSLCWDETKSYPKTTVTFCLILKAVGGWTYIIILVAGHEVLGHVDGQDVGEELLVVRLQVLHLLLLLWQQEGEDDGDGEDEDEDDDGDDNDDD